MPHARPDYAIAVALFGVLLAIGVPALRRGQFVLGGIFIALAIAFALFCAFAFWRERRER